MSGALTPAKANTAVAQQGYGRAMVAAAALAEEAEQRKLIGEYVRQQMVEGTDYGVIPGTERKDKDGNPAPTPKTLLKPGAEKLVKLFRCSDEYEQTRAIEDWDRPLFHYEFKCQIVSNDTGAVVATGVGSCNSWEKKYRWRNADRACPACGQPAIKRSKFPPRNQPNAQPGWYCYGKAGGCGANFDADDASITGQTQGRMENPDVFDCVNTILKIAKKRALVDAAISLARCSDMFTQDVEDFHEPDHHVPQPAPAARPAAKPTEPVNAAVVAARKLIAAAATLPELKTVFEALPMPVRFAVNADKDRRKAELSKPPAEVDPDSEEALFPEEVAERRATAEQLDALKH